MTEVCDGAGDDCPANTLQPDGAACADPLYCNGADTCLAGACADNPDPCVLCDEVANAWLKHQCPLAPQSACRHAAKPVLILTNKDDDGSDRLTWKMVKADASSFANFSDPRTSADQSRLRHLLGDDLRYATAQHPERVQGQAMRGRYRACGRRR